jgi:N-acetylneuraminic acid mutarotase
MERHLSILLAVAIFLMGMFSCKKDNQTTDSTSTTSLLPPGTTVSSCSLSLSQLNNLSVSYSSFISEENTDRAALYLKDKIFFAGGFWIGSYATPEVDIYDITNRTWLNPVNISIPRGFISTSFTSNKAIFAGGYDHYKGGTFHNTVDILDVTTMNWHLAKLSEAKRSMATASIDNKAYFIGGRTAEGFSKIIDVYSEQTNSWSIMELSEARGFSGAAVIKNQIYIGGGQNKDGNIKRVDIYEPGTGQWSFITAPNEHPKASVIAAGSRLFIAGGDEMNNKTVDIYDTQTNAWETIFLSDARASVAIALVKNKIIFMGNSWSPKVDVYDISSGTWQTSCLSSGIVGTTAAGSGSFAMFGGFQYSPGLGTNQVIVFE